MMSYTKTILCLAASRRHRGYCFAGKDIETGEWIRPVSARTNEEISVVECTTPSGTRAKLLDVLEIPLIRAVPRGYQTENYLIDPTKQWKKRGEASWQQVEEALDDHSGPLWLNESASWGFSRNRVSESSVDELHHSLVLIRPERLRISVGRKGGGYEGADKRLVKAYISHAGVSYTLAVTDPAIEDRFRAGRDRIEEMTGAILCVSLGEIYHGYAYKLVAAVIEPPSGR
ncbi:MAG: hypothetical protein ACE5H0_14720 [Bacteroidota bacterium]